ncbi:Phosphoesterase-domain-containing protein [Mycena venus]|uniref:Phosphoesterase-domain-containing protein n=1 Tax=Mycena venus TaxID=2733690 RepID=A0A8H6Y8I0_9AGAR|nr:Phosphoesterase-domain-containing protein [Mycena venus]
MSPTLRLLSALLLPCSVHLARAATADGFVPPSRSPLVQTSNYTSFSNNTLNDKRVVKGKVFNRIIQVWLENTDFETATSTPTFESLMEQGILFTNYNSVTHPSEPNCQFFPPPDLSPVEDNIWSDVAAIGGDFFGMADDNMYHIPSNISTVVDLLEDKDVSWATYQENMATDGSYAFFFAAPNYASPESPPYPYYMRKHNGLVVFDAISQDSSRAKRIRTFNDFANDVVNGTLPQWIFVTPNMVNDAHDTTIDFAASFLEYWLLPLLTDPRVNGEDTLILLTFDENHTSTEQNRIFALALGTAVPLNLRGTTDDTLYTHYSSISTVEANWNLKSLGRQDTNPIVSNVFSFVAEKTGYKNVHVPASQVPQFNLTAVTPGALTSALFVPFAAPNLKARGAGSGGVLTRPGLDEKLTPEKLPPAGEHDRAEQDHAVADEPRDDEREEYHPLCGCAVCVSKRVRICSRAVLHAQHSKSDKMLSFLTELYRKNCIIRVSPEIYIFG